MCLFHRFLNPSSCVQLTVKPNKPKYQSLEQRIYCRAKLGEQVTHAQKTPGPSGFQGRGFGSFFKVFFFFFLMWMIFWLRGTWDLSSLTRDWTHTPCIVRGSLNHRTAREVPQGRVFKGNSWGDSCTVNTFLLVGFWWNQNRVGLQESQASASSSDQSGGFTMLVIILHLGGGEGCRTQKTESDCYGGTGTLFYPVTVVSWLFSLRFCIPSSPSLLTPWICSWELRKGLGD